MTRRSFSNIASLVDYLLDRYEKNPDASRWAASIDRSGLAVDEGDAFEEGLVSLEKEGGIDVVYAGPKWERVITSVKLRDAGALYQRTGRQPAPKLATETLAALRERDDLPEGASRLIDEAAFAWGRKLSYLGIESGKGRTLGQVLRLAGAICERLAEPTENEMDFRTFSRLASGDSKALERNLSSVALAITRLYPQAESQIGLDAEELLASAGIRRLPQPVLIHGSIALDGQPFPKMPFVGTPAECAGRISLYARPTYLLTIENFASFVRYVREIGHVDDGLVIYSGGFPSRPVIETIARLARQAAVPTFHWGDMDAGGVRIFRYIEQQLLASAGVRLHPHMMNADLLRRVGSKGQGLVRIGEMAESSIAELASVIEQTGFVHEQEEFDPQSPLAARVPVCL